MTNAVAAFRSLIVYAMILPLALVLGYMMATPMDPTTLIMLSSVLMLLSIPLLLRWHHPILFLTWNMTAVVFLLPGRPQIWMLMAFLSLFISIFQRALSRDKRFVPAWSVLLPVIFLGAVVVMTAQLTGGFGMRIMGGEAYGGRRYLMMLAGVAGFIAMVAQRIPPHKAMTYVGLFFLGTITDAVGTAAPYLDPSLYFIFLIFPVDTASFSSANPSLTQEISRFFGLAIACQGIYYFILARYNLRQLLGWRNLPRFVLTAFVVIVCTASGFRSYFILMGLTLVTLFWFEGLFRTRYAGYVLGVLVVGGALLIPFASKLPLSIQRTLSFLPLEVDPVARYNAQMSTEWRIQIWKGVLPDVPKYFWLGKGLGITGYNLDLASDLVERGRMSSAEVSVLAGDYHSGPLSTIIPFGIWGVIGWLWFLAASIRALYLNYRYGDESLKKVNTFLFAYFVARTIYFMVVFGGLYTDLAIFAGIIGLNLSLNGGIRRPVKVPQLAPLPEPEPTEVGVPLRPYIGFSR